MPTCYITIADPINIASRYYVVLRDQSGAQVAIFDDWISLSYKKELNDRWSYTFVINGNDSRKSLFELDGQIEIYRSIPGAGIDWYREFEGLHRAEKRTLDSDGKRTYTSMGAGYNDLLARRVIGYNAGTIRSDKSAPAETVMKEYVMENCGLMATEAAGRVLTCGGVSYPFDGLMQGFTVDIDSGSGTNWEGSRAGELLLDVLKDIAQSKGIDFQVYGNGAAQFIFRAFPNQIGQDRTTIGLDSSSGLNSAGYSPVVFSDIRGTISDAEYIFDRQAEANAIMVMGDGEGATRDILVYKDVAAIAESPWNQSEINRGGSNQDFCYQLYQLGEEVAADSRGKKSFSMSPLQQPSLLYGRDYDIGYRVTFEFEEMLIHQRITEIAISITEKREDIALTLSNVSGAK